MLMSEWPEEARKNAEEAMSIGREIKKIFPEEIGRRTEEKEIMDRAYFLTIKMNFKIGSSIDILRKTLEDKSINESYRNRLKEDVKWMEGFYSNASSVLRNIFHAIEREKFTNAPE